MTRTRALEVDVTTDEHRGAGIATQVLGAVRARFVLIACCGILSGAMIVAAHYVTTPQYRAQAQVFFRQTNLDSAVLEGSRYFAPQSDPARVAATNLQLVQSPVVADRVALSLGAGATARDVEKIMTFDQLGQSDIVGISATDPDALRATEVANLWAEAFVAYRREVDRQQIRQASALVRRELAALRAARSDATVDSQREQELTRNLERLRVVEALQTGDVEFLEPARPPTRPVGLSLRAKVAGGVLIGLIVGLCVALIAQRLDRRVKDPKQAVELLDLPLLATLPRLTSRAKVPLVRNLAAREALRGLAVRLRFFNVGADRRVFAVVSGASGEGKTSLALGMGHTAALAGRRTLVIDADLRLGDVAARHGCPAAPGLSEVLAGQARLDEAIVKVAVPSARDDDDDLLHVDGDLESLWILPRGSVPPNPVQLLASEEMRDLLQTCRDSFEQVVVDTAPMLIVSDALPLLVMTDGFIVVARAQRSTVDGLQAVARTISETRPFALGVVLNDLAGGTSDAGYYTDPGPAGHRSRARTARSR